MERIRGRGVQCCKRLLSSTHSLLMFYVSVSASVITISPLVSWRNGLNCLCEIRTCWRPHWLTIKQLKCQSSVLKGQLPRLTLHSPLTWWLSFQVPSEFTRFAVTAPAPLWPGIFNYVSDMRKVFDVRNTCLEDFHIALIKITSSQGRISAPLSFSFYACTRYPSWISIFFYILFDTKCAFFYSNY